MFRKFFLLGSVVLAPACALAGDARVHTVTVQGGQGQAITVTLTVAEDRSPSASMGYLANAPYSLADFPAPAPLPMRAVQIGQSGLIWIPQGR